VGAESLLCVGKFGAMNDLAGPNPFADAATLRDSQIVIVLKIEPKLRGQTEVLPRRMAVSALMARSPPDDFIDARKLRLLPVDKHSLHWLHELGLENFSRMNRNTFLDLVMVTPLLQW